MLSENIFAQVHAGMEVDTSDGHKLGKVAQVWYGTDPTATNPLCDDDICSRLEVRTGGVFKRGVLYVPVSAVVEVTAGRVILNDDAATVNEHNWIRRPPWIVAT